MIGAYTINQLKKWMDNEYEGLGQLQQLFKSFVITIQKSNDLYDECYEIIVFPELDTKMFRSKQSKELFASVINQYTVAQFPMYDAESNYCRDKAFEDARNFGNELYHALKDEYKVRRVLGNIKR